VPSPTARGAPASVSSLEFKALSQCRWAFSFSRPYDFTVKKTCEKVCAGAAALLEEMESYMLGEMSDEIRGLLVKYGFAFDIALGEDGKVVLMEANPFGALSGCGACLQGWKGAVWVGGGSGVQDHGGGGWKLGVRCFLW